MLASEIYLLVLKLNQCTAVPALKYAKEKAYVLTGPKEEARETLVPGRYLDFGIDSIPSTIPKSIDSIPSTRQTTLIVLYANMF